MKLLEIMHGNTLYELNYKVQSFSVHLLCEFEYRKQIHKCLLLIFFSKVDISSQAFEI